MRLVEASQPFSFNYTAYDQDPGLFVAFSIYDVTSGTASFLTKVVSSYAGFGSYMAGYTGSSSKTYLVIGIVYTDNTYLVADNTRAPSSDVFQVIQGSITYFGFAYAAYDQETDLTIKATVYNVSSGTPVLTATAIMTHVAFGVYFGSYSGSLGSSYEIVQVVYTSNTYITPDLSRAPGCDGFDSYSNGVLISCPATLLSNNSGFSNSILPPINISQGDDADLILTAVDGDGNPVNLIGATFTTYINGPNGVGVISFANSNHTINSNQTSFTGQFSLALSRTETASLGLGSHKEIITMITIGGGQILFRGPNTLQVYPPVPLE